VPVLTVEPEVNPTEQKDGSPKKVKKAASSKVTKEQVLELFDSKTASLAIPSQP